MKTLWIYFIFLIISQTSLYATSLESGVPQSDSVAKEEWKYYEIETTGADSIDVNITGLTHMHQFN